MDFNFYFFKSDLITNKIENSEIHSGMAFSPALQPFASMESISLSLSCIIPRLVLVKIKNHFGGRYTSLYLKQFHH